MKDNISIENKEYLTRQINERYEKSKLGDPAGLKRVNSGSNRVIYKVKDQTYGIEIEDMVVKIQYPGSIENRQEVKVWNKYRDTKYSDYLVPIPEFADDYSWILMPHGEPVPKGVVDDELHKLLQDLGGTDISKDDFVYMSGNFANQRCADFATLR